MEVSRNGLVSRQITEYDEKLGTATIIEIWDTAHPNCPFVVIPMPVESLTTED